MGGSASPDGHQTAVKGLKGPWGPRAEQRRGKVGVWNTGLIGQLFCLWREAGQGQRVRGGVCLGGGGALKVFLFLSSFSPFPPLSLLTHS